ncbi:uncharacterized protein N7511_003153 [Penicillium nucicola]|uniref:uncharacterized protein n=1 Tax=Penicillium nucicola TaxID=1850975 RepID=UPI0025456DA8|nr:uncharacterized protein N7511_003153 [Penicillium nucicola]KAJ5771102.1 hypothetical protein N7511_003153 [Penicillium nucicola]
MASLKIQSAVVVKAQGEGQVVDDISIPSPEVGQLLVRTHAVGLNPSDWMALDTYGRPGAGLGYDFSGEVVELGEGVRNDWSIGDRVAGFVHACHAANYSIGSFRQYLNVDEKLVIRLPDSFSSMEASTIGMGISTAAQALYQVLKLPLPEVNPTPINQTILIYGGSSATGNFAIQFAKLWV